MIVVLGASGFIGKAVVAELKRRAIPFGAVTRWDCEMRWNCDARDAVALAAVLRERNATSVINCAAHVGGLRYLSEHPAEVLEDNLRIVQGVYESARMAGVACIVNPIANCTYPANADIQREYEWLAGPPHPSVAPFAHARRMVYPIADAYFEQYGIRSVNWIMPNAYGPGDSLDLEKIHALNGIVLRMIRAQKEGVTEFSIWGSGNPVREWIYSGDAAGVLVDSVVKPGLNQVWPVNIAQTAGWSINEITKRLAELIQYSPMLTHDMTRPDGAASKILSDYRFREIYRDFKFTNLLTGLQATLDYYREEDGLHSHPAEVLPFPPVESDEIVGPYA